MYDSDDDWDENCRLVDNFDEEELDEIIQPSPKKKDFIEIRTTFFDWRNGTGQCIGLSKQNLDKKIKILELKNDVIYRIDPKRRQYYLETSSHRHKTIHGNYVYRVPVSELVVEESEDD